jgi:thioesterase domain-containing protein
VIVLAMARQLEDQGERVAFLGVLDTQPALQLYEADDPDPIAELAAYVDPARRQELLRFSQRALEELRHQLTSLPTAERVGPAVRWAQRHGFLPAEDAASALEERYRLLRDAALFVARLPERSLVAPLHVWWTSETIERHGSAPVEWARYAKQAIEEEVVSGDHFAVLRAAAVHERLRALLAPSNQPASEQP